MRRKAFQVLAPLFGLALFFAAWHITIALIRDDTPMAGYFAPIAALKAAANLAANEAIWIHTVDSLRRVFVALFFALVIGMPIGLLLGVSRLFEQSANLLFQFLRMVSPLSWMPVAVIALGVGDAPVYFLLAFAASWSIILNTAAGVKAIDPKWLRLAKSLSATKTEVLLRIIIPAIVDHTLIGVRLAIGIIWIVLVPAEMLGVQAGLGYFILDCRDRMDYAELTAAILWIGVLGAILDFFARFLRRQWHRRS
ncbi:MAG: ABC transporter permease [Helicobacteraceae bacterium]|nr:ABC transporter permease [Helicobacteraceae bacterium]